MPHVNLGHVSLLDLVYLSKLSFLCGVSFVVLNICLKHVILNLNKYLGSYDFLYVLCCLCSCIKGMCMWGVMHEYIIFNHITDLFKITFVFCASLNFQNTMYILFLIIFCGTAQDLFIHNLIFRYSQIFFYNLQILYLGLSCFKISLEKKFNANFLIITFCYFAQTMENLNISKFKFKRSWSLEIGQQNI
ncbi:hypothetical protein ACJX0J_025362, partial [Zea mays]